MRSTFVKSVEIIDPDTGLPDHIEVRRLENGLLIGLDECWLEHGPAPVFSPYHRGVIIDIPDNEERANRGDMVPGGN